MMSTTHIVKVVTPIEDEATSGKRATDNDGIKYSRKRIKLRPKVHTEPNEAKTSEVRLVHEHEEFKFLELPAELRNQIYEYAAGYTYRCFPILYKRPRKVDKQVVPPWSSNSTGPSRPEPRPIPYLALTQTCMQIRAEFRPMWLSMHRLPLNLMNTYFKVFFPARMPKGLTRFKKDGVTASSLRIWLRKDDLGNSFHCCDATRLFKHKARFPDCAITCQSFLWTKDRILRDLEQVINHDSPVWRKSVRGGRISQVRLGLDTDLDTDKKTVVMDMVVRERFAEPWMKAISAAPPEGAVEGFLRQLGFATESRAWKTRISVDYS